jgi:hypothetical protein
VRTYAAWTTQELPYVAPVAASTRRHGAASTQRGATPAGGGIHTKQCGGEGGNVAPATSERRDSVNFCGGSIHSERHGGGIDPVAAERRDDDIGFGSSQ